MQFLFTNTAWLWLLPLAAAPLIVHLFARSNPPRFRFSSTAFLQRIMKKTARLRKPQDWLLLLLRTLAAIALLFVFLQPILTGDQTIAGGRKTTVYLIDRSASMAAKDGSGSRFSAACAEARELLASGGADEANVIWIDARPDALFPQPGPNLEFIADALTRAGVSAELGAPGAAIQLATSQLDQVRGERELVILSDFQSTAWNDFKLDLPADVSVVKVRLGTADVENLAVHELFATPDNPVVGQDVLMVCRLRNYAPTPRRTTLYLDFDGGRQSREVEIPAWGEAEMNFRTRFVRAGQVAVSATIAEDVFPGDDTRHALVRVRDALRLTSIAPGDDSLHARGPGVLDRLAASLDWLEHRTLPAGELPAPGSADYLFLHSWDGSGTEDLRVLAGGGTTLLVQPAVGASLRICETLMGLPVTNSPGAIPVDTKAGNRNAGKQVGWKAGVSPHASAQSPTFALFQSGEFGNPVAGVFRRRLRLPTEWPENVRRLIDYEDGIPGLLATPGTTIAPVVLWNLPLSSTLGSWSVQSSFVPFMGELLLNHRATSRGGAVEAMPGDLLSWTPGEEVSPDSVTLSDGDGHPCGITVGMTPQGVRLTGDVPVAPGIHQWKIGEGVAFRQVVNFPTSESDLRLMDPADLHGGEVVDTRTLLRRAELGEGIPLWPWFVATTLLLLLIESVVAMWHPKPKKQTGPLG